MKHATAALCQRRGIVRLSPEQQQLGLSGVEGLNDKGRMRLGRDDQQAAKKTSGE